MSYPNWDLLARSQWYDREPKSRANSYLETVAFHGLKRRITYTCPSRKKAMVELLACAITRIAAAAAPDNARVSWVFEGVEVPEDHFIVDEYLFGNAEGDHISKALALNLMMFPDDSLVGYSANYSDGDCIIFLAYKLTEFDANPPEIDVQLVNAVKDPSM